MNGKCERCGTTGSKKNKITRHHIWPKRFFHGKGDVGILCRNCHDEIERIIPTYPQRTETWYETIYRRFIAT